MWKAMLAGTTALTLIGGSLVYAQQTPAAQPGDTTTQQRHRMTPEERAAFTETRITELKTGLQLTPAQQRLWPAFETALHDAAKQRAERFEQFRKERETTGAGQRPARNAAATPEETAEQKKLAAALDPLYKTLDEGQRQRFATMFRTEGEGRQFWFRGGRRS